MNTSIVSIKKTGYVTLILPYLYLGDIETSQDKDVLHDLNIDHIINLSNENEYYKWNNITYTDIQIEDSKSVNILTPIDQCMSIIDTYRKQRKNILVHCVSGVSRSVSIVLSYLIYQGLTLKDAFSYMKQLRTKQYTLPNIGFFKQLMTYEKIQCGAQTMTISDYISMRNNV